jgi:hypothetical protein
MSGKTTEFGEQSPHTNFEQILQRCRNLKYLFPSRALQIAQLDCKQGEEVSFSFSIFELLSVSGVTVNGSTT